MPLIRSSTEHDLPAITAIYREHVLHGTGTFEIEPPTLEEMTARRADVLAKGLPYLVLVEDTVGQAVKEGAQMSLNTSPPNGPSDRHAADPLQAHVLGFAYCNWFKPRPAYRFSAEDSIYMASHAHRKGLGRALLSELCHRAQQAGVRKLIAVIGDSANHASIGVHRTLGFNEVGTIAACGWKFERWLDIVLMEKPLGWAHHQAPHLQSAQ
jgi:phosphinothricin acetyltransferase